MRIVALLAVRNEELYIERCIKHLIDQGIDICLIDNDSTDKTLEIANQFRQKGLFRIERVPYNGVYEWEILLRFKEKLALEVKADWFIHHDADEIREAPIPYNTLLQGIEDVDKKGFNAINFDEFVFLPTTMEDSYEGKDYVKEMHYYYYLCREPLRRVNAWKKTKEKIDLVRRGGHQVFFKDRCIFPEAFILRHYIALSGRHLIEKYSRRVYSEKEVKERGWHKDRIAFDPGKMVLPKKEQLKIISNKGIWDRSDPWIKHNFMGAKL